MNVELLHHIMSMKFDGSFRGAERMRNLFVRPAARQQDENLLFTGGELRNQSTQGSDPTASLAHFLGVHESAFNRLQ